MYRPETIADTDNLSFAVTIALRSTGFSSALLGERRGGSLLRSCDSERCHFPKNSDQRPHDFHYNLHHSHHSLRHPCHYEYKQNSHRDDGQYDTVRLQFVPLSRGRGTARVVFVFTLDRLDQRLHHVLECVRYLWIGSRQSTLDVLVHPTQKLRLGATQPALTVDVSLTGEVSSVRISYHHRGAANSRSLVRLDLKCKPLTTYCPCRPGRRN